MKMVGRGGMEGGGGKGGRILSGVGVGVGGLGEGYKR